MSQRMRKRNGEAALGVTASALGRPISLLLGRNLSSDPLYAELCRWKRQDKNTKKKHKKTKLPNTLMTMNYKG